MKSENETIIEVDFAEMGNALAAAQLKIGKALRYGYDMRSSRLLLLRDAANILNITLTRIDGNYNMDKAVTELRELIS